MKLDRTRIIFYCHYWRYAFGYLWCPERQFAKSLKRQLRKRP